MTIKQQGGIFGRNPTFNDVSANTTTTDTLTADASADGSVVTVKRDGSDVGSLGAKSGDLFISSDAMGMRFRDSISAIIPSVDGATSSDASFDLGNDSNRWRKLYLSGNLVVASGSGIDFSATSGTGTSELFDDYEEGTWTPAWSRLTAGDFAYSAGGGDLGLYTKIGNTVYASFRVQGTFTEITASGTYCITGLPFTKDANEYPVINIRSTSSGTTTVGAGQAGGTKVLFFGIPVSGQNYLGALVYRV